MPVLTQIGALKFVDRVAWKKQIRDAMKSVDGRVPDAAKALGVSDRQLFRWLAEEDMTNIPRAEFGLPRDGKRGRRKVATPVVEEVVIPTRRRRKAAVAGTS